MRLRTSATRPGDPAPATSAGAPAVEHVTSGSCATVSVSVTVSVTVWPALVEAASLLPSPEPQPAKAARGEWRGGISAGLCSAPRPSPHRCTRALGERVAVRVLGADEHDADERAAAGSSAGSTKAPKGCTARRRRELAAQDAADARPGGRAAVDLAPHRVVRPRDRARRGPRASHRRPPIGQLPAQTVAPSLPARDRHLVGAESGPACVQRRELARGDVDDPAAAGSASSSPGRADPRTARVRSIDPHAEVSRLRG